MNLPTGGLFRTEVLDARSQRVYGEIVLTQPVRTQVLVIVILAIAVALFCWVALGTYTRTETARGILVTDQASAKVIATRPGLVTELSVREGDVVHLGQRLAIIQLEQSDGSGASPSDATLSAIEAQRGLANEQMRLALARATGERARVVAALAGLRQQRADLLSQIVIQKQAAASAQEVFERFQSMGKSGFISRNDTETHRQTWLGAREETARLQQQLNTLNSQEAESVAELSRIAADSGTEITNARVSVEGLVQQKAKLQGDRGYTIVAPVAGRVAGLQAAMGRTIEPAVPLMTIVPERSALHVEVFAPTRAIGFVRPGQKVRLLYDAFPYQRFGSFGGRIVRVSRTVMDPRELSEPLKIDEAVYRVEVRPDAQTVNAYGENIPLQPGMALTASLILERSSFFDWLLQPLNAVLKRNH